MSLPFAPGRREKTVACDREFVEEHASILDRLDVAREPMSDGSDGEWCCFDDWSIKAFQCLHILLHELGHHHDRMTTRSRARSARGEGFAEKFANDHTDRLWADYCRVFGR